MKYSSFLKEKFQKMGIATRIAIPVVFFLTCGSFAKTTTVSKTETYKDIIEKAQLLSLQKDRQQALLILELAYKKEVAKSVAIQELKRQIQAISRLFISDRTQGLFELGVSFLPKDLPQAQAKIAEALRVEPDNLTLQLFQMRLFLNKRDCSAASSFFVKNNLKRFLGIDQEIDLLQAQINVCQKNYSEVQSFFNSDYKKHPLIKFWYTLEIERSIEGRNFSRAKDLLAELIKLDKDYVEIYYWDWKLNFSSEGKSLPIAQKYLLMCKNMNSQSFRTYFLDPFLCSNTVEIEKASNN